MTNPEQPLGQPNCLSLAIGPGQEQLGILARRFGPFSTAPKTPQILNDTLGT